MSKRPLALFVSSSLLAASPLFAQRWGREATPGSGACFYENTDYRGDYFCVGAGEGIRTMPLGMNDRVSSIRIFGRAEVTVFQDARYEGRWKRFRDDVRHLRSGGWNDKISSLRVRSVDLRGDEEDRRRYSDDERSTRHRGDEEGRRRYSDDERSTRQGMTRSEAEEIVRHAYLAVLDREPDPGSRGYVDKVLREDWTRQDVERDLRKSDEYRDRRR